MTPSVCQKCGAVNQEHAVVCTRCGTRLDHREQRWYRRMWRSELWKYILSSPGRMAKTGFHGLKTVVSLCVLVFLLVLTLCYLGFFFSFTWHKDAKPEPGSGNTPEIQQMLASLYSGEGDVKMDPAKLSQAGNQMLQNLSSDGEASAPSGILSKIPFLGKTDSSDRYFSARKEGDARYVFTLHDKFGGKLPMRLSATFEANREKNGQFEVRSCRLGNIPISLNTAKKLAARATARWNPDRKFGDVCNRIKGARMQLSSNMQSDAFVLEMEGAKEE